MKIKLLSIKIYVSKSKVLLDIWPGCFALKKSREAKQWLAAKLCVMKQQGNKKGDKKEKGWFLDIIWVSQPSTLPCSFFTICTNQFLDPF